MPAVLMILFGYAVTLDVKKVPMAVLDRDRSQEGSSFVHRFSASPYFSLRLFVENESQMKRLIDEGEIKMGLVLPWDFSDRVRGGEKASVGPPRWNGFEYSQHRSGLCPDHCPPVHAGEDVPESGTDGTASP